MAALKDLSRAVLPVGSGSEAGHATAWADVGGADAARATAIQGTMISARAGLLRDGTVG
jgi:hypothetical protein